MVIFQHRVLVKVIIKMTILKEGKLAFFQSRKPVGIFEAHPKFGYAHKPSSMGRRRGRGPRLNSSISTSEFQTPPSAQVEPQFDQPSPTWPNPVDVVPRRADLNGRPAAGFARYLGRPCLDEPRGSSKLERLGVADDPSRTDNLLITRWQ